LNLLLVLVASEALTSKVNVLLTALSISIFRVDPVLRLTGVWNLSLSKVEQVLSSIMMSEFSMLSFSKMTIELEQAKERSAKMS
jgi:hypothetical protein